MHSFVLPLTSRTPASSSSLTSSLGAQVQNSYYAAAGAPAVDMSRYDLPLDRTIDEWTAVVQASSSLQEGGVFLKAKDAKKELFVDTLQFSIRRAGGLGLILTEIAGGRSDGIGITIVEEILAGGNSAGLGLVPGDSIVSLSVSTSTGNGDVDTTRVSTECLGYDATIDAITSLPPPASDDEAVTLTVKRVRRQPRISIRLQYPPDAGEEDVTIELFAGENLRRAMLTRGIKLNDRLVRRGLPAPPSPPLAISSLSFPVAKTSELDSISPHFFPHVSSLTPKIALVASSSPLLRITKIEMTSPSPPGTRASGRRQAERFDSGGSGDCGSDGTCATCVVGVSRGMELLSPMGQQEGQILSKKPRWRMACKAVVGYGMVEGDMTLQVNPRQW